MHNEPACGTEVLLPVKAQLSSSKTRHGGRHNSFWLSAAGFHIARLDANGERWHQARDLLSQHAKPCGHGHSGSKYTMDPKHSWSNYNLDPEASDKVMRSVFGTSVCDELNRLLSQKQWVIFKRKYCLPQEKLRRFISTRCRDKTWCDAVRFREAEKSVVDYLLGLSCTADEDDFFGEVELVKAPKAPDRERMRWRCEECGLEGYREAFRERTIPGLAGSTGLNCPTCGERKTDAISSLLSGVAKGDVRQVSSKVMYPTW